MAWPSRVPAPEFGVKALQGAPGGISQLRRRRDAHWDSLRGWQGATMSFPGARPRRMTTSPHKFLADHKPTPPTCAARPDVRTATGQTRQCACHAPPAGSRDATDAMCWTFHGIFWGHPSAPSHLVPNSGFKNTQARLASINPRGRSNSTAPGLFGAGCSSRAVTAACYPASGATGDRSSP